ncbi:MAG: DUF2961 domain-containing protein [Armatimonadia bacterium]|nr:DUF2961 domain-containing protein [Armatimonadia bacterium]
MRRQSPNNGTTKETTMRIALLTAVLLIVAGGLALAQPSPGPSLLDGLETLRDFEAQRASSCDPNWKTGNGDNRPIPPGETLTLAELEGPGRVGHIWFTIAHSVPFYSRLLTLRMYWDGEEHPSVECPIGDFFGIGHGVDQPFQSIPVSVSSDGRARNCYWPMPFRESARITVTNESDVPCGAFFYYIDWQQVDELPDDTAYFHAMYRQEFPAVMGRNYMIADIEGRGHYVGTVQSVYHVSPGWYGEGDDFFFIDGEEEPRLRGTGTEDYFCDAWGFRQFSYPSYGVPLWEGYNTGDRGSAYRWHLTDPVPFSESLWVEIEHKGSQHFPNGEVSGFIERDDLMSSVAYWYQTEPHKPWPELPPGPDRLPFTERVIAEGEALIEGADLAEAPIEPQSLPGTSGGSQLFYRPEAEDGWVEVSFDVEEDIDGYLILRITNSWDYGIYQVSLDGDPVGEWDLYAEGPDPTEYPIGLRTLEEGEHTLRFECVGSNAESEGYFLGFDAVVLRDPVYSRPADVDLRDLQVERED